MHRASRLRAGLGRLRCLAAVLRAAATGLLILAGVSLLSGCGDRSDTPVVETGQITVGIRDAAGDFVHYAVDVTSLRLQDANGNTVETVPLTTPVDFGELSDLTELFTVATIPAGTYTQVVLGLDFSNAQIVVQDANGNEVPATARDTGGNQLTTLTVTIQLPDAEPVRIEQGIPAVVTLDFDLDASNTIDLSTNPARVTMQPLLSMVSEFEQDREHRARGLLTSVDHSANTVTLNVRPFQLRDGEFGKLTFGIDGQTRFDINGTTLVGDAGLNALGRQAVDTPVIARGTVTSRTLTATTVIAGTSVPWANGDVVSGVVSARAGDTLTVRRANIDSADGTHTFRNAFSVLLDSTTRVNALSADPPTRNKDSISVGQRIVAFGTLSNATTLDARSGRVRMDVTPLIGDVVQLNPLAVNLDSLGGLYAGAFDFSSTGNAVADADPSRYVIDTSTLDLASVSLNDLAEVRGLVRPFGFAPPAFNAQTVVDADTDSLGAWLMVSWGASGGSANPFTSIAPDRIGVDLTDPVHTLNLLGLPREVLDSADQIALLPSSEVRGVYLLTARGSSDVQMFRDFASLTPALTDQLAAGKRLVRIVAMGRYSADSLELTAPRMSFEFSMQ